MLIFIVSPDKHLNLNNLNKQGTNSNTTRNLSEHREPSVTQIMLIKSYRPTVGVKSCYSIVVTLIAAGKLHGGHLMTYSSPRLGLFPGGAPLYK